MNSLKDVSNEERFEILNNRKSFPFYRGYEDTFKQLTNEEGGKLLVALINYQFYGELPEFVNDRILAVTFNALKGGMDAAIDQYISTVLKNRDNGHKGGRPPKTQMVIEETQNNPENPDGYSETDWPPSGFLKTQTVNLKPSGPQPNPLEPNRTQVNPIREDKIREDRVGEDKCDAVGVPYKGHPDGCRTLEPPYDNNNIFMAITKADEISKNSFRFDIVDSLNVFKTYFGAFKKYTGNNHPSITFNNIAKLIDEMPECCLKDGEIISLTESDYPFLVDAYFETDFKDCDRNINHFFSGEIRGIRIKEIENGKK